MTTATTPAVSPSWSLLVAESVTGRRVGQLPISGLSWSHGLRFGSGTGLEATVPLDGPPSSTGHSVTQQVRDIAEAGTKFLLVAVYGRRPIAYGFISGPAPSPGSCSLGTIDLAGLLRRRSIIAHGQRATPSSSDADVELGPASKPELARLLLAHSIGELGATLPLVLGTPSPVGDQVRTYNGFSFTKYGDALADLVDDEDGPDIRVTPQLSADQRWVTLRVDIGEPYVGSSTHHWECPGSARTVTPDYDHSQSGVWHYVPGDGNDYGKPVGVAYVAGLLDAGVPLMDRVDSSRGSTGDADELNSVAAGNARVFGAGLESLTLVVDANGKPQLGTYAPGDACTVRTQDHWWLGTGRFQRRIVAVSGDHTDVVTVTTAPATQGT